MDEPLMGTKSAGAHADSTDWQKAAEELRVEIAELRDVLREQELRVRALVSCVGSISVRNRLS